MAWLLQGDDDKAIIAEIERESDRGMIIIGVSFLESRLEELIKLLMASDMPPDVEGRMFKGIGPLASFAAKIDLGFLFQFYPEETGSCFISFATLETMRHTVGAR